MSLQARLDRLKTASAKRVPPDAAEVMQRATDALRSSGIMERIPQVGDSLPPFELQGQETVVSSQALLGEGPLVISFYRGGW